MSVCINSLAVKATAGHLCTVSINSVQETVRLINLHDKYELILQGIRNKAESELPDSPTC